MMHPRRWLTAIALTVTLTSLAPTDGWAWGRRGPPDVVEDALAFALTDRSKAIKLLENTLAEGVPNRDRDEVRVHAGEQRRLNGDLDEARAWFQEVIDDTRRGDEHDAARLGLALVDATEGVRPQIKKVLRDVSDKAATATMNADRYLLLAADAATRGENGRVTAFSRKALSYATEDPAVLARVETTLEGLAGSSPEESADVLAGGPMAGGSAGGLIDRAEEAWASGDRAQALKLAERAAKSSDPAEAERGDHLVTTLRGPGEDPNRIVVLLPLSGKYGAVGANIREALEYGYGSAPRRLDVIDSGGTPESAVAALEQAAREGAIAAVGPLLSDETEPVVAAADRLNIPLLTLSQAYEDPSPHRWTLQAMYTRADQVDALLDHVMDEQGMEGFAIFAPDNDFGSHAVELFVEGVEERGGTIQTQASYDAEEKNLLPFAKELGVREGNIRELREQAEERGGNPDTVVLPPRIDFDGIFLPESARRTPLACAALAYEEFPMGEFQPTRDSPEIPLLGLATWNTEKLVTTGNEYTRNSLFPDVFSAVAAGEDDPFVAAFRRQTGRTPSALEAAIVDAGKLLGAAARSDAQTRPGFRDALLAAESPDAVTGATGFNAETRRAKRTMRILTITRETLEQVGEVELDGG